MLSAAPRYTIAMTIGYRRGERDPDAAGRVAHGRHAAGPEFWARGYCVSAVGLDEDQIRRYIRDQEELQQVRDQGELDLD